MSGLACTAGENACPPEDVGGTGGYASFLEAIADPKHEEHHAMLDWVGYPFDRRAFDLNVINQRLARIKAWASRWPVHDAYFCSAFGALLCPIGRDFPCRLRKLVPYSVDAQEDLYLISNPDRSRPRIYW
jgi:hypothetical protein